MADDIVTRLRCAYRKDEDPPCEACTFCAARAEIERLRALVDDYENGIMWETDCTNCAKLLYDNYDQYCEIVRLRAAVDSLLADIDTDHKPDETGRLCRTCSAGDGSWPCVHRMALDELKEARRG